MKLQGAISQYSLPFLAGWAVRRGARRLTGGLRTVPDFIIIGAQRAGTTSLYNYLAQHPNVMPAFMKETHFFDNNFRQGMTWYRAFFPLAWQRKRRQRRDGHTVTGEATPYYLFYPHAPKRVAAALPQVKLIVMLRNPIDRAYSHYHHEVSMGLEPLSFEKALAREERELAGETDKILQDEHYRSFFHQNYTYLARGIYVDQLERWTQFFRKEQILVLNSEEFNDDPAAALWQVTEFLNLPSWELVEYKKYHLAQYAPMDPATRERLVAHFAEHNRRLYAALGMDFGWEAQ